MKRFNIVFALVTIVALRSPAQSDLYDFINSAKETVEQGNHTFEKPLLMQGHSMFERALASDPDNVLLQYHLAYAEYRLMTYLLNREKDNFNSIADRAEERLEKTLRKKPDWSEAQALLSGIYGLKIAHTWTRAMILGPRANRLAQQATENDPDNPRAWLMHGSQKLNTPKMFGGSMDEALTAFQKSVALYEQQSGNDPLDPTWGYIDALVWLGIAYEQLDRDEEARVVFLKVLEVEPEFRWVKYNLLPALEEKLATTE